MTPGAGVRRLPLTCFLLIRFLLKASQEGAR